MNLHRTLHSKILTNEVIIEEIPPYRPIYCWCCRSSIWKNKKWQ